MRKGSRWVIDVQMAWLTLLQSIGMFDNIFYIQLYILADYSLKVMYEALLAFPTDIPVSKVSTTNACPDS